MYEPYLYQQLEHARASARKWRIAAVALLIGGTVQWLAHLATLSN